MNKKRGFKLKGNLKYLFFIIVLLILVSAFFMNFFRQNEPDDYNEHKILENLSAISTFDYSEVTTVEKELKKLEINEAKGTFDVTKPLTNAQYKKIFNSSVILGDSITEGLVAYGCLSEDQVFCKIGASIINGDELFIQAANTYPGIAFLAFGMNDMGNYSGKAGPFIKKYKELIKEFKEISPNTVILVNGISAPSRSAMEKTPILKNYKNFNEALKDMCKELKLTYIDNTYIIKDHPDFYAGDGVHVSAKYYPYWMNNMILKAGL